MNTPQHHTPKLAELLSVKGLGPSTARRLHEAGIPDLPSLISAANSGTLLQVKGIGPKSAQQLLKNAQIAFAARPTNSSPSKTNRPPSPSPPASTLPPVKETPNPPKAASPKVASPQTASPKAAPPKAAPPQTASPQTGSPKAAPPQTASPKAASPKAASPKAASPKAASPKAASPKAAPPKAPPPKAPPAYRTHRVPEQWLASRLRCDTCHHIGMVLGPNMGLCPSCGQSFLADSRLLDLQAPPSTCTHLQNLTTMSASTASASTKLRSVLGTSFFSRRTGLPLWRRLLQLKTPQDHPLRVLEVGCGAGEHTLEISAALKTGPGSAVVGVDVSPTLLQSGAARARKEHLNEQTFFIRAEAHALPFAPESFDRLYCGQPLTNTHQAQAIAEFERILKPGGVLVLAPSIGEGLRPKKWIKGGLFAESKLLQSLNDAGFRVGNVPRPWLARPIQAHKRITRQHHSF